MCFQFSATKLLIIPLKKCDTIYSSAWDYKRPPRNPNTPIVSRSDYAKLIRESGVISTGVLGVYGYSLLRYGPGQNAGTNAFMAITLAQFLHSYRSRSEHTSIFNLKNRPSNRYLDTAIGISGLLQLVAVTVPSLRTLFRLSPLNVFDIFAILAGSGLPFLANEAFKGLNKNTFDQDNKT